MPRRSSTRYKIVVISVPTGPGIGMELDERKIDSEREVTWEI